MLEGVADRIQELIDEVGRTVQIRTLNKTSGSDIDPVFGTPTDVDAKAAIVQFKATQFENSLVQADDKKVFIAANTPVTKQNKIVDGENEYQIIELREVTPGGKTFLYIAQCRR